MGDIKLGLTRIHDVVLPRQAFTIVTNTEFTKMMIGFCTIKSSKKDVKLVRSHTLACCGANLTPNSRQM